MHRIDLTDFAGLILFGLLVLGVALAYLGFKLRGKDGAILSAVLMIVGMFISLVIVSMMEFRDASPETVLTISICTIAPPIIYNLYSVPKWLEGRRTQKAKQSKGLRFANRN